MFLLAGRKRKKTKTSAYLISTDPTELTKKSESFVAKVRSNMMGTRFEDFDDPNLKLDIEDSRVTTMEMLILTLEP